MPITITITDPTPEQIAALFGPTTRRVETPNGVEQREVPKATRAKKPPVPDGGMPGTTDPEDAALAAEIAADVAEAPPEPKGATQVVDAGTGKPLAPADDDETTMTFDEVKAAATKLATRDMGQLAAILKAHGAGKLSEVADDQLGSFATAVMAALEALG